MLTKNEFELRDIGQEINSKLNDFKGHLKDLSDEAFKLVEKDRKIMLEYN